MKYCVNCGQECNNHDVFCPNCGSRCDVKASPKKDYNNHTTFTIIIMLLILASIVSSLIVFLVEYFNGVLFVNPAFDRIGFYILAFIGEIAYFLLGVFVMILYHLDVRRGRIRTLTKVLCFFVSIIACIIMLCDKER